MVVLINGATYNISEWLAEIMKQIGADLNMDDYSDSYSEATFDQTIASIDKTKKIQ